MSEKICKKLTMGERFLLLKYLPKEGDLLTFKSLRKFRESLAPTESELFDYDFLTLLRCPHVEYGESRGKRFQCEVEANSQTLREIKERGLQIPQCPIHNISLQSSGKVTWNPEKSNIEKEIWFGLKIHGIIIETLKRVSDEEKKIGDDTIAGLYEKFIEVEDKGD